MKSVSRKYPSVRLRDPQRPLRAGFTLLELLLTSLLSAVLLAGLWSLFNTYMRLFETGQSKTEQSQLVRALAQQLADDLHSIAVAPPAATPQSVGSASDVAGSSRTFASSTAAVGAIPTSSTSPLTDSGRLSTIASRSSDSTALPRFSLVGTSHALKLEVLQSLIPDAAASVDFANEMDRGVRTPTVPELRTVLYSFEQPRESRETDRKAPPGLLRVELDWRAYAERIQQSRRSGGNSATSDAEGQLAEEAERLGLVTSDGIASLSPNSSMHVPEVTHCAFRYFDGRDWLDEWDSRVQQSLPAAVEVSLLLSPPPQRWKPRAQKAESDASTDEQQVERNNPAPEEIVTGNATDFRRPVYRQVIALPTSENRKQGSAPEAGRNAGLFGESFGDLQRRTTQ